VTFDKKVKFIDLFAGIGGFHHAAMKVFPGAECVMAVEWDKDAQKTYAANFGEVLPHGEVLFGEALQVAAGESPGLCGVGASALNNVLQKLGLRILLHVLCLPVRPARAGAWGATQHSTPQRRWSASDPSASPYQRWHRSGPRVGDPLVAAPSSS
jgi:hypothetical protein